MILLFVYRFALILCIMSTGAAFAASSKVECPTSDDNAGITVPLPEVARALQPGRTLNVLAIGSATMFGPEASLAPGTITSQSLGDGAPVTVAETRIFSKEASERAFPRQMVQNLKALVPGADVQITVRGGRGLLATDMLALMRTELASGTFQLVIWQTGTVEAVRNLPPGEFGQTLSDGVEIAQAAHADMVLIDPQYSRFLQTNSNLDPYIQALQQVASLPGVVLFRRFDLMRNWANDGHIDLERTARVDRQRVIEALHACLGRHLARLVLDTARM